MQISRTHVATVAGVLLGFALTSTMVVRTTQAVITSSTATQSNTWTTGGAAINNDGAISASAVFSQANDNLLAGGQTVTKCIAVKYTGNSPAQIKLYGSSISGGLASYLDLKIETGTGTANDCTNFVSGGTLFSSGTVAGFGSANNSYANGLGSWNATLNNSLTYKFSVTVQNVAGAQNGNASAVFNWEAQAS
ncbi:hypothetical protein [Winogradskya humida]|uniref:Camelysin-like metallo-endopeptidase n=1 Tax=Winogradskya humida TaxID=113566 RepID=A0ABQ3ZGM9_9ACTN|nr:hypothetical protein [Actinoplanes humidus]GIE17735.1 hypothetical protein Ahu01nite_008370 [Actinoplanes humidus]